jgi:hypothetical protein
MNRLKLVIVSLRGILLGDSLAPNAKANRRSRATHRWMKG